MTLRQVNAGWMYRIAAVLLCLMGASAASFAQTEEEGGGAYALDFLTIGVGARAAGMGNAHTALAEDATAAYWNPAGLAEIEARAFAAQHGDMFQQSGGFPLGRGLAQYNYLSAAMPFEGGVLSVSWTRLGVDDIPRVTFIDVNGDGILGTFRDLNQNGVKDDGEAYIDEPVVAETFSNSDDAFAASYARRLTERLSAGGSLKIFRQSLFNYTGAGAGFDLGGMYRISDRLKAGLTLQDMFGSRVKWNTPTRPTFVKKMNARLGLAGQWPMGRLFETAAAADIHLNDSFQRSEGGGSRLHVGAELTVLKTVSFRAGFDAGDFTAGAGARVPIDGAELYADYAFMTHPDLGDAQRISLSGTF